MSTDQAEKDRVLAEAVREVWRAYWEPGPQLPLPRKSARAGFDKEINEMFRILMSEMSENAECERRKGE